MIVLRNLASDFINKELCCCELWTSRLLARAGQLVQRNVTLGTQDGQIVATNVAYTETVLLIFYMIENAWWCSDLSIDNAAIYEITALFYRLSYLMFYIIEDFQCLDSRMIVSDWIYFRTFLCPFKTVCN